MNNQEKFLREVINLGVLYLLFVTVMYYFFIMYNGENATKIFIQSSAGLGFLFIVYWAYGLKYMKEKISKKFISFFRLSFLFLGLSVLFIGQIASGSISSMLIGDIMMKFVMFSFAFPIVLPIFHLIGVLIKEFVKIKQDRDGSSSKITLFGVGVLLLVLALIMMVYFKLKYNVFEWSLILLLLVYVLFIIGLSNINNNLKKVVQKKLKESERLLHLRMNQALALSIFGLSLAITFILKSLEDFKDWNDFWIFTIGVILFLTGVNYLLAGYQRRYLALEVKYLKEKSI
ncbi:hypothetical protein KAR91_81450 [Candidatus Pacearchaeota archaeon]|nr:hypothetical protein [Candidatus Pacearchaeota archaeon]